MDLIWPIRPILLIMHIKRIKYKKEHNFIIVWLRVTIGQDRISRIGFIEIDPRYHIYLTELGLTRTSFIRNFQRFRVRSLSYQIGTGLERTGIMIPSLSCLELPPRRGHLIHFLLRVMINLRWPNYILPPNCLLIFTYGHTYDQYVHLRTVLVNCGSCYRVKNGVLIEGNKLQTVVRPMNRRSVHRPTLRQIFWAEFLGASDWNDGFTLRAVDQTTVKLWSLLNSKLNFFKQCQNVCKRLLKIRLMSNYGCEHSMQDFH